MTRSQETMKASARKCGRNIYKPLVVHPQFVPPFNIGRQRTETLGGRFFTREDAVARAQAIIDHRVARQAASRAAYAARHSVSQS